MKFAGWSSVIVGVLMLGQWIFFISAGQVPELETEPIRIGFHLAAEGVTAIALIATGVMALRKRPGAARLGLVANGMLAYTAIVSPGYFAQKGEWPLVGMFAVVLGLAIINILAFAQADMREAATRE